MWREVVSLSNPVVSVVIPLYNKSPTIARTLHSVFRQTFEDFDVVVVDDGSTDDGVSVAEEIGDPRLRVVRQANGGPGSARNRGVFEGRGSLLAFIDADDEWRPTYLERMVAEFQSDEVTACATCGYTELPSVVTWVATGLLEVSRRVPCS